MFPNLQRFAMTDLESVNVARTDLYMELTTSTTPRPYKVLPAAITTSDYVFQLIKDKEAWMSAHIGTSKFQVERNTG